MINLRIDEDQVSYSNSFLMDQKIQFVIDSNENNKKWYKQESRKALQFRLYFSWYSSTEFFIK